MFGPKRYQTGNGYLCALRTRDQAFRLT